MEVRTFPSIYDRYQESSDKDGGRTAGEVSEKVFMGLSGGCIYQGLYDICPSDPDGRKVISDWDRD